MGISRNKKLVENYFDPTGWVENTFTSITAQNLTHLTSTTGGVALISLEAAPTVGTNISLATGDYADFRAPLLATADGAYHPSHQFLSTSAIGTNIFSSSGSLVPATATFDSSLLNCFGASRILNNLRFVFIPANTTVSMRLASVNLVASATIASKLIPFPDTHPISLFSVGSWTPVGNFSLAGSSLNLTQLDASPTPIIPPGYWVLNSVCRFNVEASITKTQTITLTRSGASIPEAPYRLPTRTAASDTGTSVYRVCQLYIAERHPVSQVVLTPISSAVNEHYVSALHIPYEGIRQVL